LTKDQFEEQLQIAQKNHKEFASLYWCGFARGLQRAYFGSRFSKNTDHFAWLDFPRDADRCVAELGRGYRDGLQAVISYRPRKHFCAAADSAAAGADEQAKAA
jgi:hypothetical protein